MGGDRGRRGRQGITPRLLEVFCVLAEQGSFTAAARALGTTQSTVSAQVGALERRLGIRLCERGRTLRLTPAGRLLCREGAALLSQFGGLAQRVAEEAARESALRVAASSTVAHYLLPPLLSAFKRRHPDWRLEVDVMPSEAVLAALRQGEAGLGFCFVSEEFAADLRGLHVLAEICEPMALVVAPGSHLSRRRRPIGPRDFDRLPLVLPPRERSPIRRHIERVLAERGLRPHVVLDVQHAEAIKRAVEAGTGAAILGRATVRRELRSGDLREIELPGGPIPARFCCLERAGARRPAPVRAFLEEVGSEWPVRV